MNLAETSKGKREVRFPGRDEADLIRTKVSKTKPPEQPESGKRIVVTSPMTDSGTTFIRCYMTSSNRNCQLNIYKL